MLRTRYVFALGLMLIALTPVTAQPARDAQGREIVAGRSYPDSWPEVEALNHWNPVAYRVTLDGLRAKASPWDPVRSMFGWFCYQTFVDPGDIWSVSSNPGGSHLRYVHPLSEGLRSYFKVVAAACQTNLTFGDALKLLFENVDVFTRDVPLYFLEGGKVGPLSKQQRAPLLKVAEAMRQVMASKTVKPETKAAAHLIVALTEGNECPTDAVDTRELERIHALYPEQRLMGFLSQYYLYCTLVWSRWKFGEADRIAERAIRKYSDYQPVRDLGAYKDLQSMASHS